MRAAIFVAIVAFAACRPQQPAAAPHATAPDTVDIARAGADSADSALLRPRVITEPTVVVFWIAAADTFSAEDQSQALDDMNYATEQIAPELKDHDIKLVPTNSDTIYVALPNHKRRTILLTGLDYPFGYVLVEPGTAERILAGVYDEDELLDEIEAYFDLPSSADSTVRPRIST